MGESPDSAEAAGLEAERNRDTIKRLAASIQRRRHQILGLARLQQQAAMADLGALVAGFGAAKQSDSSVLPPPPVSTSPKGEPVGGSAAIPS